MTATPSIDPELQSVFDWVERQRCESVATGTPAAEAAAWASRRRYAIGRQQWDPTWKRIKDRRSRFSSMLFKKFRRRMGGWGGANRITSTCDKMCGCGWQQLRDHIESLFKPGMTWENHGKGRKNWVIDHIKPVCLFDWWTDEGLAQAFHWQNVQPLWYSEHRAKSNQDIVEARRRQEVDPEYRKRLRGGEYAPPLKGTDEQILAQLAAQLGVPA